jgi:hypothetical protein
MAAALESRVRDATASPGSSPISPSVRFSPVKRRYENCEGKLRIAFVCQAGELEVKAAVLAASLRHELKDVVSLIGAVPKPDREWGEINERTRKFMHLLDVELVPVKQPFGVVYPIANKISALGAAGHTPALLLDTDILCLHPPPLSRLSDVDAAAKPADRLTFDPGDSAWPQIYTRYGLPVPQDRVITSVSNEITFPYYNAGVVFSNDGESLADRWMTFCGVVQSDERIARKGRWVDQVSLPLAIQSLGWRLQSLGEEWNYPAHLRQHGGSNSAREPFFVHYHSVEVVAKHPALLGHLEQITRLYTDLSAIIASDRRWEVVARGLRLQR